MHSLVYIVSRDKNSEISWDVEDVCNSIHLADSASEETPITIDFVTELQKEVPELLIKFNPPCFEILDNVLSALRYKIIQARKKEVKKLIAEKVNINWYGIAAAAWPETGTFISVENDGITQMDTWLLEYAEPGIYYVKQVFDYHF